MDMNRILGLFKQSTYKVYSDN